MKFHILALSSIVVQSHGAACPSDSSCDAASGDTMLQVHSHNSKVQVKTAAAAGNPTRFEEMGSGECIDTDGSEFWDQRLNAYFSDGVTANVEECQNECDQLAECQGFWKPISTSCVLVVHRNSSSPPPGYTFTEGGGEKLGGANSAAGQHTGCRQKVATIGDASTLIVTDGHPAGFRSAGQYFGFDDANADAFFGTTSWDAQLFTVTANGKTDQIRVWRDNINCEMSCGRWEPYSASAGGQWSTGDSIAKPCVPYSEEACLAAVKAGGYHVGNPSYPDRQFADNEKSYAGCYVYNELFGWYGTFGTDAEKQANPAVHKNYPADQRTETRPRGWDCNWS